MSLDVLLGGALGALGVFFLGWLRDWWRSEQQRRGLLRLLLAEIKHNEIVIAALEDAGKSLLTSPFLDSLKTETWQESREAAAGLPAELLNDLVSYYEPLEIFQTLKSLPPPDPNRPAQSLSQEVERMVERIWEPLNRLLGSSTDRRETYQQRMLRAQARAKKRIDDYLDRPLFWAPLTLWAERWALRLRRKRSHL